jgi:hypothetical protein
MRPFFLFIAALFVTHCFPAFAAERGISLDRPVKVNIKNATFSHPAAVFEQLSQAADVDLIAQYYRKPPYLAGVLPEKPTPSPLDLSKKHPLKDVIHEIGERLKYDDAAQDGVLLFKDRTRYRDDDFQLDLDLDHNIRTLDRNRLDLQSLLITDLLTDKQRYLLSFDYPSVAPSQITGQYNDAYLLYNQLDDSQKDQLETTGRLMYSDLNEEQQSFLRNTLAQRPSLLKIIDRTFVSWQPGNGVYSLIVRRDKTGEKGANPFVSLLETYKTAPKEKGNRLTEADLKKPFYEANVKVDGEKVTAESRSVKIGRLLEEIARQNAIKGGEKLSATKDVYSRPVTIFVHDEPMEAFKKQLAAIYDLEWRKAEGGDVLFQSQKNRAEEERLRQKARDREREAREKQDDYWKGYVNSVLDHAGDGDFRGVHFEKGQGSPTTQAALKAMSEAGEIAKVKEGGEVTLPRERILVSLLQQIEGLYLPKIRKGGFDAEHLQGIAMGRHGNQLSIAFDFVNSEGNHLYQGDFLGNTLIVRYPYTP